MARPESPGAEPITHHVIRVCGIDINEVEIARASDHLRFRIPAETSTIRCLTPDAARNPAQGRERSVIRSAGSGETSTAAASPLLTSDVMRHFRHWLLLRCDGSDDPPSRKIHTAKRPFDAQDVAILLDSEAVSLSWLASKESCESGVVWLVYRRRNQRRCREGKSRLHPRCTALARSQMPTSQRDIAIRSAASVPSLEIVLHKYAIHFSTSILLPMFAFAVYST
jgi:hypothetical protein